MPRHIYRIRPKRAVARELDPQRAHLPRPFLREPILNSSLPELSELTIALEALTIRQGPARAREACLTSSMTREATTHGNEQMGESVGLPAPAPSPFCRPPVGRRSPYLPNRLVLRVQARGVSLQISPTSFPWKT